MSEVTGYSKEESFDENLVDFCVAPSMKDSVEEILAQALAGNETSNYELEFVSKSGEPIFLLVNATTRRDPSNDVVGVVGVAQDVTEDRKHAKELREMQALRASQEAKVETERNMTAYFAHELRNPLGAIDSALKAMPDELPETAKSLVAGMQLCTGFMSSIMNNLLDVRKMEEGKMRLTKAPISLRKLITSVHKMLMPSVRKGVDFRMVEKVDGKDWILGDAHRIQQVLTNVVTVSHPRDKCFKDVRARLSSHFFVTFCYCNNRMPSSTLYQDISRFLSDGKTTTSSLFAKIRGLESRRANKKSSFKDLFNAVEHLVPV
jgi:PAS domain S-box-containing protein